jgi:hypothetical protein
MVTARYFGPSYVLQIRIAELPDRERAPALAASGGGPHPRSFFHDNPPSVQPLHNALSSATPVQRGQCRVRTAFPSGSPPLEYIRGLEQPFEPRIGLRLGIQNRNKAIPLCLVEDEDGAIQGVLGICGEIRLAHSA